MTESAGHIFDHLPLRALSVVTLTRAGSFGWSRRLASQALPQASGRSGKNVLVGSIPAPSSQSEVLVMLCVKSSRLAPPTGTQSSLAHALPFTARSKLQAFPESNHSPSTPDICRIRWLLYEIMIRNSYVL